MNRNAILVSATVIAVICMLPPSARAQTEAGYAETAPMHPNGGLGFHSVDAPLGGRYWFGEQKVGLDFGLGLRSTPAPDYDEDLMGWAVEIGVPIVMKSWDKVHLLFRPGIVYDSQNVLMSDPPDPFATDDRTTLSLTAELEAEVFIVDRFSVSASHGIGYLSVDPAGGGDSESSWGTLGNNFSHIGFHYYFFGG